jgi:hypothetical protein
MIRDKYQAIGVVQINGKLSGTVPDEFMTTAWLALRGPEILKTLSGPECRQTNPDFFGSKDPMLLFKLHLLVEGFFCFLILKGYNQIGCPSIIINPMG